MDRMEKDRSCSGTSFRQRVIPDSVWQYYLPSIYFLLFYIIPLFIVLGILVFTGVHPALILVIVVAFLFLGGGLYLNVFAFDHIETDEAGMLIDHGHKNMITKKIQGLWFPWKSISQIRWIQRSIVRDYYYIVLNGRKLIRLPYVCNRYLDTIVDRYASHLKACNGQDVPVIKPKVCGPRFDMDIIIISRIDILDEIEDSLKYRILLVEINKGALITIVAILVIMMFRFIFYPASEINLLHVIVVLVFIILEIASRWINRGAVERYRRMVPSNPGAKK